MIQRYAVLVPQMSVNDEFATLRSWEKNKYDKVRKADIVASVETTKALYDIETDAEGFLIPIAKIGVQVRVSEPIAVVSSDINDTDEAVLTWLKSVTIAKASVQKNTEGKKYTKKAQLLAKELGVDLDSLPKRRDTITEQDILAFANQRPRVSVVLHKNQKDLVDDKYQTNTVQKLLIVGGGRGAIQLLGALRGNPNQKAVAILDDDPSLKGSTIMQVPIRESADPENAKKLLQEGVYNAAVISVSTSIEFRKRIFSEWVKQGIPFANVIHPTVHIGGNVSIGSGNVILAFCHIGECATIGNNNFLSAYTNIEHHNQLGSHCSFGPSVCFSSRVIVGDCVRFGTGIFVEPGVSIGENSILASGTILMQHVPKNSVVKNKISLVIQQKKS